MAKKSEKRAKIVLNADVPAVKFLCGNDPQLARVIRAVGEISCETFEEEPFRFLVHEIVEQMLSVKAGERIFGRICELCGGKISPRKIALLSEDDLRAAGTSRPKARAILGLAQSVLRREIDFKKLPEMSDADAMRALTSLRGIGNWTAKMYLIFVLGREDVLPLEDGAFVQVFRWLCAGDVPAGAQVDVSPAAIRARGACWRPYSSLAARFLYAALDSGLTRRTPLAALP